MTTLPISSPIVLPTKDEVLAMLRTPAVLIVAMLCGTALGGGALFLIYQLLEHGRDASVITTFVLAILNIAIYAKLRSVEGRTTRIEAQANDVTSRLMDHAVGTPPVS